MLIKVAIGLGVLIAGFLGFVSTRDGKFRYERSGVIHASPEEIYPYISNLKKGELWSPYEKPGAEMKKTFHGSEDQPGAVMEFEGDAKSGSGKIEILSLVPNESVELRLTMLKPFYAENLVQYKLTKEDSGTRFTWSMSGDGGFMGKLMNVLIDCEAMIAGQFTEGINNLKQLIESKK